MKNEINQLITAINNLAKILEKSDMPFEISEEKNVEKKQQISHEEVRNLAKEKMAKGISREEIKKLIFEISGKDKSILDLNNDELVILYNKLTQL